MTERENYKLTAYRELVNRSSTAAFYSSFGDCYRLLAYVSELAAVAARNDAKAYGLTHAECENAYRIGFFRGDQGAASAAPGSNDLAFLDTQEKQLTQLLEECLNLTAAPVRF